MRSRLDVHPFLHSPGYLMWHSYNAKIMRVPCLPNPPTCLTGIEEQIVQRITDRRAGHGLLPLDLVLLHAPEIANGGCTTSESQSANLAGRLLYD